MLDSKDVAAIQTYYDEMSAARKKIVGPLVIVTLVVFFLQQFLTNFTSVMDVFVAKGLSLAYLYACALFFYAVIVTMIYQRAMDKVEAAHRPPILDADAVGQYEDWKSWEAHEGEREAEEEARDELQEQALADEVRRANRKETDR